MKILPFYYTIFMKITTGIPSRVVCWPCLIISFMLHLYHTKKIKNQLQNFNWTQHFPNAGRSSHLTIFPSIGPAMLSCKLEE